jgi:hypothetical protein
VNARWLPALVLALGAATTPARADTITLGVFAPTAPFPSLSVRFELATRLGEHVGKAIGQQVTGKVFARAGEFAAAVKRGEVTVALVDAAYLAVAGGNYTVIAVGLRGDNWGQRWQLVARGGGKLGALRGKRVLVPSIGGREVDFVLNVMLGGEVSRAFFAPIETAPDTASALAALGLGKVDAAVVPTGIDLPQGVAAVLALPSLPGPVLVVYGAVKDRAALIKAATSFHGDATVEGFRTVDVDVGREISRRLVVPAKRGPLAVPAIRLLVGDLVEGRTFAIERTPATTFVLRPDRR